MFRRRACSAPLPPAPKSSAAVIATEDHCNASSYVPLVPSDLCTSCRTLRMQCSRFLRSGALLDVGQGRPPGPGHPRQRIPRRLPWHLLPAPIHHCCPRCPRRPPRPPPRPPRPRPRPRPLPRPPPRPRPRSPRPRPPPPPPRRPLRPPTRPPTRPPRPPPHPMLPSCRISWAAWPEAHFSNGPVRRFSRCPLLRSQASQRSREPLPGPPLPRPP